MQVDILPIIHSTSKLYLSGPFGSGKTTLAMERIRWLLKRERTRGDDILVLTPQRTLGRVYFETLYAGDDPPHGPPVHITTVSGLARNAVELYWPLVGSAGGFAAGSEPTFLNLETAQYHMAQFVDAALDAGEFDGIRVERSRVISQVLDNLNKAALQAMSIDEAYERLELAVPTGDQRVARINALRAARQISQKFRALCYEEALVDFSLMIELFNRQVLVNDWSRTHLFRAHKHLIADNIEEDNISAHNLMRLWLPNLDSALLIADDDAGFRLFLGADPAGGYALANECEERIHLDQSYVNPPELVDLADRVQRVIGVRRDSDTVIEKGTENGDVGSNGDGVNESAIRAQNGHPPQSAIQNSLTVPNLSFRFYPQMIEWVVDEVRRLVQDEGVPPNRIALLAPFVSDALRFSLQTGLDQVGVPSTTHRPSRELQAEPAARCLLTLAKLAHPEWGIRPSASDVAQTISLGVSNLDPVRASLLTRIVYPEQRRTIELGRFGELNKEAQQRITYTLGEAYDRLREWIYVYRANVSGNNEALPLDQFFARLFGELLSQPGYGFHDDFDAARVASQLVESARNFRWALESGNKRQEDKKTRRQGDNPQSEIRNPQLGREYVRLVESGALGALFAAGWKEAEDAVLIAPAYTYMLRNRAVDVQFWLDIGSGGWWERLYQPLTHPYVLSPRWAAGQAWTDYDEFKTRQETMERLMLGLIRRTKERIYVGVSEYSENGIEQRGPLLMMVNRLLVDGNQSARS
ncbi:MAG: hypothetical protein U0175_33600 [Caldilineaceae bacterium]